MLSARSWLTLLVHNQYAYCLFPGIATSHFIVHLGISCLSVTSSYPSGALSSNCFTCLIHIPARLGVLSHAYPLFISPSINPSGPLSGNCFTCLILSCAYHIKQPSGALNDYCSILITYSANLGIPSHSSQAPRCPCCL